MRPGDRPQPLHGVNVRVFQAITFLASRLVQTVLNRTHGAFQGNRSRGIQSLSGGIAIGLVVEIVRYSCGIPACVDVRIS